MAAIKIESDPHQEVKERLQEWGAWIRATVSDNLGFPSVSIDCSVSSGGSNEYFEEESAIEVENVMCRLKTSSQLLFSILLQEYYFKSDNKTAADKLKISLSSYKNKRSDAEHLVAGCLGIY